jgi:two-component system, NtrC family, sensor histidine kinase HydH
MASTRGTPLARWSVAAAVALVGAALAVTAWTTRASVRDARDTLLRGERTSMEQAVRADLVELGALPDKEDLAVLLTANQAAGLRYIGLFGPGGDVMAEAGTSTGAGAGSRERIEIRGPRRGFGSSERGGPPRMRGGDGLSGFHRGMRIVIELEPVEAEALDQAASRTLGIGLAAALLLFGIAAFLVRWVLKRAAIERVRERERRLASLGELSAVLAHEIRNPLASLKGNAQLLAATLPAGDKPSQKAARVVEEAVRLEALTNDLLEFVRTGELKRAPVDPAALLRDTAATIATDGPDDIRVIADGAPASWPLDEARVRQVLVNLIDNAVAAGAPVEARVAVARGRLVYEVRDHGNGVAPADADKIFEPFFTRKTRGTGLGLAVARRVVEQHGGAITVSAAPGGGALFRVELPRA